MHASLVKTLASGNRRFWALYF